MRMSLAKYQVNPRRRASGFTLVEIMVTMALMAAILPVVMRGISASIQTASSAKHKVEAATLGQSKLNEIAAAATIQLDPSLLNSTGDFGEAFPTYRWQTTTADDQNITVTTVTLTVTWVERGQTSSLELSTMIPTPQ